MKASELINRKRERKRNRLAKRIAEGRFCPGRQYTRAHPLEAMTQQLVNQHNDRSIAAGLTPTAARLVQQMEDRVQSGEETASRPNS